MGRLILHSMFRPGFFWVGEDPIRVPWMSDMALPERHL